MLGINYEEGAGNTAPWGVGYKTEAERRRVRHSTPQGAGEK